MHLLELSGHKPRSHALTCLNLWYSLWPKQFPCILPRNVLLKAPTSINNRWRKSWLSYTTTMRTPVRSFHSIKNQTTLNRYFSPTATYTEYKRNQEKPCKMEVSVGYKTLKHWSHCQSPVINQQLLYDVSLRHSSRVFRFYGARE